MVQHIKVIGKMGINQETEPLYLQMEENILENGKITDQMDLVK